MKTKHTEKLANHLLEIDDDLQQNAFEVCDAKTLNEYVSRKNSRRAFYKTPLFRRLTVLAACLMLTVTTVFAIPAVFSREQTPDADAVVTPDTDKIVLPPVRVGTEGYSRLSLHERSSTIESLCEYIDAIAVIRVGNWLDEGSFHTYYDAEVLDVISGTIPEKFVLLQDGNSEVTIKGYPLFTYGSELLVFLVKTSSSPEEGCAYPNDNSYWIAGSYTTAMEVVTDEDGTTYFVDCYHLIDRSAVELANFKSEATVNTTVYQTLLARDVEGMQYKVKYHAIYSLNELAAKLPPLTSEGG